MDQPQATTLEEGKVKKPRKPRKPPTRSVFENGLEGILRMRQDVRSAEASKLNPQEVRYIVDLYYTVQGFRTTSNNQMKALEKAEEPNELIKWYFLQFRGIEDQTKLVLDAYTDHYHMGRWAKAHVGIGPIIAAGLLANIDIAQAQTAGQIWRLAGLDPSVQWIGKDGAEKMVAEVLRGKDPKTRIGPAELEEFARRTNRRLTTIQSLCADKNGRYTRESAEAGLAKRPWNQRLKLVCFHIGESFCKFSARGDCFYGHHYLHRKAEEERKNRNGEFADQARQALSGKRFREDAEAKHWYLGCYPPEAVDGVRGLTTEAQRSAYLKERRGAPGSGVAMLPPAHIDRRAKRWTVKLFLAHWFEEGFRDHYKKEPPLPYPVAKMEGHTHVVNPPKVVVD